MDAADLYVCAMISQIIIPLQERMFLNNSLYQWLLGLLIAVGTGGVLWSVRMAGRRLERREWRTRFIQQARLVSISIARSVSWIFIIGVSLFAGSRVLVLSDQTGEWLRSLLVILFLIQAGVWVNAYLTLVVRRYEQRHMENEAGKVTTARALAFVGRLAVFSLVLVAALDNIPGVEVGTLIAGLGIGGIAVALALQNVLGDLFASLSISLDRPFALGDFIIVDSFLGTVEHIGLKTTRIRSLSGEQLVFANTDLLKSRVRNYKRMEQRRVAFTVGVTYQTAPEQLRKVPDIFKNLLGEIDGVHFDRAHFKEYGPYSLNFEFVYYIHTPDYNRYMDVQQQLNLGLYDAFAAKGIEFAYPTQTLFVERTGKDPEDIQPGGFPGD